MSSKVHAINVLHIQWMRLGSGFVMPGTAPREISGSVGGAAPARDRWRFYGCIRMGFKKEREGRKGKEAKFPDQLIISD